jgi:hypothetical protein
MPTDTTLRLLENAPLSVEPDNWFDCDDCLDYAKFLIAEYAPNGDILSKQCIYCFEA